MQINNSKSGRVYDKVAYCLYCQKPFKKLPEHLRTMHANEMEVARYMAATTPEKKNYHLTLIRNRGNHVYNYDVMANSEGELIVIYRPQYIANPNDYFPCKHCF